VSTPKLLWMWGVQIDAMKVTRVRRKGETVTIEMHDGALGDLSMSMTYREIGEAMDGYGFARGMVGTIRENVLFARRKRP